MAKNKNTHLEITAGNNSDIAGINIAENCAAGNINNALRSLAAMLAAAFDAAGTDKVDRVHTDALNLDDDKIISVGSGQDLQIKHAPNLTSIMNAGNMDVGTTLGDLRLKNSGNLIASVGANGIVLETGKTINGSGDGLTITASASVTPTTHSSVASYANAKALLEDLLARIVALEAITPATAASNGGLSVSGNAFSLDATNIPDA